MAVSSSSDFTVTKRQVIERAYRIVGALKSGVTINSSQMADGSLILNSVIRELDAKRVGPWSIKESTFTTVAGQTTYSSADGLPTDIYRLESAIYVKSSNDEIKVEVVGFHEYDKINDKTTTGDPEKILLSEDLTLSSKTAKLWPVPDAAKTMRLRYRRRMYDMDSDANNFDFPGEWYSCLSFLTAAELAEEYATDDNKVRRVMEIAQMKLRDMKAANVKSVENSKVKDHEYY